MGIKEVAEKFKARANNLENNKDNVFYTLWYGTAREIETILENSPNREKAIKQLKELAEKYKEMSLSNYYKEAIKDLI